MESLVKQWYANKNVLFAITKLFKNKEGIFNPLESKGMIRWLRIHHSKILETQFKQFSFFKRKTNLYYSLAKYNDLGIFSYAQKIRKEQSREWIEKLNNHLDDEVSYIDFVLDFDSEDILESLKDVRRVKYLFDKFKICYMIQFSGKKGFHIIIKGNNTIDRTPSYQYLFYKLLAENLAEKLELKTLDLSIFDPRRIIKMTYSIDVRTNNIVRPLSDDDIIFFDKSLVDLETNINNINNIINKGLIFRNNQLSDIQKRNNFLKLVGDLDE